jgi:uncharacterized protein YjdB
LKLMQLKGKSMAGQRTNFLRKITFNGRTFGGKWISTAGQQTDFGRKMEFNGRSTDGFSPKQRIKRSLLPEYLNIYRIRTVQSGTINKIKHHNQANCSCLAAKPTTI